MSLLEVIKDDLRDAQKERNEKKIQALRMLTSAIKNEEISKRPNELEEADVLAVVKREVKKLNDAVKEFEQGGRDDLLKSYKEEAELLQKYLPEEMSEEEIQKIVKEKVLQSEDPSSPEATEGHSKNFGSIMKQVMAETKGQADGSTVSRIVKEELGK